jgi:acyl-CoA hydrolase
MALAKRDALDRTVLITASFAMGSPELYAWLDHNPYVEMRRTEVTNSPTNISQQRKMTAIQGAIQADLYGQVNATHIRGHVYSGFGGQPDFHIGAMHAEDGVSIIALHAWHQKADVSTIIPRLTEPVTTFQPSYIVTEHGAARIYGATEDEQAESLIGIADPRIRPTLAREHFNRPSIQEVA